MKEDIRTINEWKRLRLLTDKELCAKAGISTGTLHAARTGGKIPLVSTIKRICAALDVQPDQVWEFRAYLGIDKPLAQESPND